MEREREKRGRHIKLKDKHICRINLKKSQMNVKVVFEDFSEGFVKGYNTIARKDLQFASVSWFVLAWLALKWIPPRLG